MGFFDKKEEVIEIQLTQYGKHLLSRGKLAPKYYAFFDDDILYDSNYASMEEQQNESQGRIEGDTPRLKTQYVFSSREKEVKRLTNLLRRGTVDLQDRVVQPTPERHYALSAPLGNSSIGVSKAPAWKVTFLKGAAKESVTHLSGAMPTLKIPQLTLNPVSYKTQVHYDIPPDKSYDGGPNSGDPYGPGSQGDLSVTLEQYDDGSFISIKEDYILMDLHEMNTPFDNDNFDIEVFLVEEVDSQDNIVPLALRDTILTREKLYPLSFMEHSVMIKDGFLLDKPLGGAVDENPELDASYVEYWFNIWVDDEIDESVICANKPEDKSESNVYIDQNISCPDAGTDSSGSMMPPDREAIVYGSSGQPLGSSQGGVLLEDDEDEGCED